MDTLKSLEQELAEFQEFMSDSSVPQDEKDVMKDEMDALKAKIAALKDKSKATPAKAKSEKKAPKKKIDPKKIIKGIKPLDQKKVNKALKEIDKQQKKTETVSGYDCNELVAQVKARKKKAKEAAEKRANAPKKTEATKVKEAIVKVADKVESKFEAGKLTKAQVLKAIEELQRQIKDLQKMLKDA